MTAKLKSPTPSMKQLLDEVSGAKKKISLQTSSEGENVRGSAKKTQAAPKPMSKSELEAFNQLCRNKKVDLVREAELLQEKIKKNDERIIRFLRKHGVAPIAKDVDRIIFSKPYKAHLQNVASEDLNAELLMEWARTNNQEHMIDTETHQLMDLKRLKELLPNYDLPADVRAQLLNSIKILTGIARETSCLDEKSEDQLNLEAYRDLKEAGKIPADIVKAAESVQYSERLQVFTISTFPVCSACGSKIPKRRKGDKTAVCCGTCGHENK